ncbi:MAG: YjbQ family protein [Opitutales bacterium]|nr:YjbQ family protein [Opitutales bacterium]
MSVYQKTIRINTLGKGMTDVTHHLEATLRDSGLRQGLASVLCQHTSCSLVLMENADPSARADLERFLEKMVPENTPWFTHTMEGPDDMPSHIRMALTRSSENIPFAEGRLLLGTWQGLFLWEHRSIPHSRSLVITIIGE